MTGALGVVASTLPVQWLLPVDWRVLFWGLTAVGFVNYGGLIAMQTLWGRHP